MSIQVEAIRLKQDARGWVCEPLDAAGLAGQANIHVVMSVPGSVRGNHYHLRGTEVLVAIGPALLRIREESIRDIHIAEGEVHRVTVPPGVSHALQNTGDRPTYLVAFNSISHDPDRPDVVVDILIPAG